MPCEDIDEVEVVMQRLRYWPARASSAVPVRGPIESLFDPIVKAGQLWEAHQRWCRRCEPSIPGCALGEKQYAVYVGAWEQEQRAALAAHGRSRR
jgi:hypothetical protein